MKTECVQTGRCRRELRVIDERFLLRVISGIFSDALYTIDFVNIVKLVVATSAYRQISSGECYLRFVKNLLQI